MRWVCVIGVVACGGSDDGGDGEATCEDLGVADLEGTVAEAHDACVVSLTVPSDDNLNRYISSLTPLGPREALIHDRCFGVDDNATYDLVIHKREMELDAWIQDDAIFNDFGAMVWLASSSRGTACQDDAGCTDCCAQSCCDGVPVSGSGSGDPVALRDCVLVSEQGGGGR